MRLVPSSDDVKQVTVNEGRDINRHKDGTFHVEGEAARILKSSGDFAVAGIHFQRAKGFVCLDCGFHALYRDHCGRCDGSNLTEA